MNRTAETEPQLGKITNGEVVIISFVCHCNLKKKTHKKYFPTRIYYFWSLKYSMDLEFFEYPLLYIFCFFLILKFIEFGTPRNSELCRKKEDLAS